MEQSARHRDPGTLPTRAHRQLGRQLGLRPGDALLVVDVQRDFLRGGALPVPDSDEIIGPLNAYVSAFQSRHLPMILTRDWHPDHHCSFRDAGGPWPAHCVQGTPGAQWGDGLRVVEGARIISKGTNQLEEAYSGFSGTGLLALLRTLDIRRVFVGGLATDYCVHDTVMDALRYGFDVVLLADAIRAVNAGGDDEGLAVEEMLGGGATLFRRSGLQ